jgi:hypothetical protein
MRERERQREREGERKSVRIKERGGESDVKTGIL